VISLALRLLRRDWRAGGLGLVALAMVVGVAAVTAVALVGERVERGLELQAAALLGADRVLESDRPIPESFVEAAEAAGLRLGRTAPRWVRCGWSRAWPSPWGCGWGRRCNWGRRASKWPASPVSSPSAGSSPAVSPRVCSCAWKICRPPAC